MEGLGAALDVAIGLVLMYVMLSLSVTALGGYVAQVFDLRASNLRQTLQRLLDGSSLAAQKTDSVFALFMSSGQISSMAKASNEMPSYLESGVFAKGISEALRLRDGAGSAAAAALDTIERMPEGPVKKVMLDEWRRAAGKVDEFEKAMADWFDAAMERASGIFKRWMQWVTLGLGIVIALALNADAFAVAQKLWEDDALRAQIVAMAQTTAASPDAAAGTVPLETLGRQLQKWPIGWGNEIGPKDALGVAVKILGCIFTGLALAFGAPFWFDVLSKLVRLRASGEKPLTAENKRNEAKTA